MKKLSTIIVLCSLLCGYANAALISVETDATWLRSTTVTTGGTSGDWINPSFLPAGLIFDQAVVIDNANPQVGPFGSLFNVDVIDANAGVTYYKTNFNLDYFTAIMASIRVSVDNGLAIWINNQLVGAETTLTVLNWKPDYPSFDINTDGSSSNIVKFDITNPFSGFVVGDNELIIAVRNYDGRDSGAFAFDMQVTTIPEPGTLSLLALAIIGVSMSKRMSKN